ncbi:hypothetical protein PS903_01039 [Pseudomonas fluorescens]|nr:hypothetical protein PS903_01039 [Pseudomonas fluorescens]
MTNSLRPNPAASASAHGRLTTVERAVDMIDYRLGQLETRHELVPTRVTKLEQQFEHMSGQLSELNLGQQKLTVVVSAMGSKITWALAVASTVWTILQMFGPTLLRVLLP